MACQAAPRPPDVKIDFSVVSGVQTGSVAVLPDQGEGKPVTLE